MTSEMFKKKFQQILTIPMGIYALVILAGALRGYQKGVDARPEWSFWSSLVANPLLEVAGEKTNIFGYFPGFKGLLKPFFFLPAPFDLLVFVLINALCGIGLLIFLRKLISSERGLESSALALMVGMPVYYNLQNNQVAVPALLLLMLGFAVLQNNFKFGVLGIASAILIKTLPSTALLFLVVTDRWKAGVTAGLLLLVLSLSLAVMSDDLDTSIAAHINLPQQFSAQDPNRILTSGDVPVSYSNNTSLSAVIVKTEEYIGAGAALLLNRLFFVASLLLTLFIVYTANRKGVDKTLLLAFWLSWTILAAPFGRYYYLLFLTPAWVLLWPSDLMQSGKINQRLALGLLAILPFAAKNTAVYTFLTLGTYAFMTYRLVTGSFPFAGGANSESTTILSSR